MTLREWTVEDRFGRAWRIAVAGGAGEGVRTQETVRALAQMSLTATPDRGDRVAEALFGVAAEVGRQRDAHEEWLHLSLDAAWKLADEVRVALERAAALGLLRVEQVRRPMGIHAEKKEEARKAEPTVEERESDAWIGIALVDEDGRPLSGVAYVIRCADGHVRSGTTDASGRAREKGLDPGTCDVSFPGLHGPDWKKVG